MKNKEKMEKYAPTAVELQQEGFRKVTVRGMWIGARGIISKDCRTLLKSLGFTKKDTQEVICTVLKFSQAMLKMFLH